MSEIGAKQPHYHKDVRNLETIDVYRVLQLFNVADPCLQHAVKKLLVAGGRGGGKDITRDIQEAVDTLQRWQEMRREEQPALDEVADEINNLLTNNAQLHEPTTKSRKPSGASSPNTVASFLDAESPEAKRESAPLPIPDSGAYVVNLSDEEAEEWKRADQESRSKLMSRYVAEYTGSASRLTVCLGGRVATTIEIPQHPCMECKASCSRASAVCVRCYAKRWNKEPKSL